MALKNQITSREFEKFRDTGTPGKSKVAVEIENSASAPVPVSQKFNDSVYIKTALLNGASEAMNVDGSGTPAHFDFTPSGVIQYYLESLTVFLEDAGSTDIGDFGAIAGSLTNGLRILVTKSATDYELANIKNNRQLASVFSMHPMLQSNGAGFFNSTDNFAGTLVLGQPILINGSSEKVRVTVRDNLSTLDALSVFALLRRVL